MEKYTLIVKENEIIIQKAEYIEDGFFIRIIEKQIELFEIPQFGGNPISLGEFDSIIEAINHIKSLTQHTMETLTKEQRHEAYKIALEKIKSGEESFMCNAVLRAHFKSHGFRLLRIER